MKGIKQTIAMFLSAQRHAKKTDSTRPVRAYEIHSTQQYSTEQYIKKRQSIVGK